MSDELKTVNAGKYSLVARFDKNSYRGAIWAEGKMIEQVEGDSLDDAWKKVMALLYQRQSEIAVGRNGLPPLAEEARRAFLVIGNKLSTGHKAMLRAHLKAPDHKITARGLAAAAGYASYSAANLQYGLLGAMLFGEMPEILPKRKDGTPIMTCMIGEGDDQRGSPEEAWIWKMRPHIVEGLAMANII